MASLAVNGLKEVSYILLKIITVSSKYQNSYCYTITFARLLYKICL